jgi:hypothetical protein
MQGAGRNLAGVDPDRARLDQMSRMDAARNPNASVYGNPGGMDRPDMQQDRVYSTVQDRDPGMSGGGYLRGADAGAGRDRMAQMIERSNFDRRSRAFGPKPPTGVASYGVSPMEESSVQPMEDTPEARTRMEDMQAAYGQQAATAEPPPPPDMGRRAMGMGRGLPPRRRFTI